MSQFIQNLQGNEETALDPVFANLTVKRGVSKITVAVIESSLRDWDVIRLELYGFRAGTGIKLSHFSVTVFFFFFFELIALTREIALRDYIRNVQIRDQGFTVLN